jgi:hypothetical protein
MPADDATGPSGRAASIGFYANADDSPRVVSDSTRSSPAQPAGGAAPAAVAPHGSGLVVALATVLLAGTAIGFVWALTPAGHETPVRGPSTAPAQRPPEPPPAAEPQPPAPSPAPVIEAPAPARAAHLARQHRALTTARPLKSAVHRRISQAQRPLPAATDRRPHRGTADLADNYARAIADLDRRRGEAARGEPPF